MEIQPLEDWENVKRNFRYLKGTINCDIKFSKKKRKKDSLRIFADADYAEDLNTRKSTSSFLFIVGDLPTSCCSKLQQCVATSTAEEEYYSLGECEKHALWYMNLFKELNINLNCVNINVVTIRQQSIRA